MLLLAALTLSARAEEPGAADEEIEVEAEPAPATPAIPAPAPPPDDLLSRIAELEARLSALESAPAAETVPAGPAPAGAAPAGLSGWAGGLRVEGYVQAQYVHSQLSQDEVSPEGEPLNQDRFLLRRARLAFVREDRWVDLRLELDANTVSGLSVTPRRAWVDLHLPAAAEARSPLALYAGLFDVPFGFELQQSSGDRLFMERTLGSRALFPSDADVGAQLHGAPGPLRYQLSVVNGEPLSADASEVFTAQRTFLGRLGVEAGRPERVHFAGGASFLSGTGFHAGTPATKSVLLWTDTNLNGLVSLDELGGVSGQASSASEPFSRWGAGLDLQVGLRTPLGWSRIQAEATVAANLDRGLFVADPVSTGYDLREIAWNVAAIQDVSQWATVAFRVDSYDGNSDAFEARRGLFLPADVSVLTLSPVAAAQVPGVGRLVFQYDYVVDHLGRDLTGEPIDLPNDQWVLRMQVEL